MLDEGRRRHERGQDVVVGAIQPKTSPDIEALLGKLEVIPLQIVDGRPGDGSCPPFSSGIRRFAWWTAWPTTIRPAPPIPAAGRTWSSFSRPASPSLRPSIFNTSTNCAERVERITGKNVTQTVPRSFLNSADEIVVVDAPPEMCIERAGDGRARSSRVQPGAKAFGTSRDRAPAGGRCSGSSTGSLPPAQRDRANVRRAGTDSGVHHSARECRGR